MNKGKVRINVHAPEGEKFANCSACGNLCLLDEQSEDTVCSSCLIKLDELLPKPKKRDNHD